MKILTIAHPCDPLAHFVATAFHQSFLSLGHMSSLLPQYESGYDMCLVMYAHVQYNFPEDKTYKIAYNWEYSRHPRWHKNISRAANQFNCIWEMCQDNIRIIMPTKQIYCPIGYHSAFELLPTGGDCREVSFLGYLPPKNPHRKRIVDNIEKSLGLKIWCTRTRDAQIHQFADSRIPIADIIHNTKIHLNIHQNPKYPMFESIRVISFLLSNKKFVISEAGGEGPLVDGQHYIETKDFPNSIKYYLAHPEECVKIASCGYDFIKSQYRLIDFVANCLEEL